MKCKDKRGQIVMPIFYHMDPSEVRKQKVKYGEALAKHESENKNVVSWRKALTDVGNLSGWETKHIANGHEAKCIREIVDTISSRLSAAISSDNEDLIGIGARLQHLKSKMKMESDGVVMVGIWGIGGGGKTTLASALYDEISSRFDGCCFVDNIREESSKSDGLPKLQERILSLVLKQKQMEVNRVVQGRCLIKSRLCRKKVLIVLDDVDHLDQLKSLAGSHDWFGEGSRIIITTRDNHLLNAHKVNVMYNICLLNDDEAIKLFYKHAPRHGRPMEDYARLSQAVISYARGLPLALIVLGSFLCDKDKSEWMSALARLKDIPDIDIVEKLKISYDGLEPVEKELFLDIACFFRGRFKDEAMVILDACGFHPIIGVKVLIQKALITVSEEGRFDMHDLIQEMGHYIVRGENPKNPELHSRVWEEEDVVNICAMDATTENDTIEALQIGWLQDVPPSLPEAVANMKKLRWISCYKYRASSFSRKFQPTKLCCLQLESSFVEQLWEGYKHLPRLKVLDLRGSKNLIRTPDFKGLPCLERIILEGCTNLKQIHPSIGHHEKLIFLDMEHCTSLEIFPPIIKMKKLETLILSNCTQLCKFHEIESNMDSLEKLCLRGTKIEYLPSSVGRYCTKLLSLDLSSCFHLKKIEGNLCLLKHLKELHLNDCKQLKIPVEGLFDVECCLHVLSLSYISLRNLDRKRLGFSHSLKRLSLGWCKLVDGDMSVVCKELSNLQVLDLSGNDFSQLHCSLSHLTRLKFLDLSDCNRLVQLPDLPSNLSILKAGRCKSLKILGDFPTNLTWLWKVLLPTRNCNKERVLQSMFQGNAFENHFISLHFVDTTFSTSDFEYTFSTRDFEHTFSTSDFEGGAFTLQLPWNWYNEFSGFLIQINGYPENQVITIMDVMDNREDAVEIDEYWLEVADEIDEDWLGVCDDDIDEDELEVCNDDIDEDELEVCYDDIDEDGLEVCYDDIDEDGLEECYDDIDEDGLEMCGDDIDEDELEGCDDDIDEDEGRERCSSMCYISFGSLKHTSWWNSTHTAISFFLLQQEDACLEVELVPIRGGKGDSIGSTTNYWDEEVKGRKTFEIVHDSKSSIEIQWHYFS
ncbi:TMV resistance protein N-like [Cynara cardunculus var. scolymus]|uniref:TMV resistance protein N-like n=1 Tax=Cynara cardunculus var. scolymus TaxID=59895 RepID=UPI000D624209|nr:TMV resistance protein N-like [Cynara cardunculus var. scolymus]